MTDVAPKVPGCCTLCGEPCFDIQTVWPHDDPRAGQPRRIGQAHEDALRADLVLIDGTRTTVTVHARCFDGLDALLPAVWRAMLERMRWERKAHRLLKQAPFSPAQHAHADAVNLELVFNVPLGVLAVERWVDHGR